MHQDNTTFQSTLPARGATSNTSSINSAVVFQSTLPARGATKPQPKNAENPAISIHAPRTGSDDDVMNALKPILTFQSTLPARGATIERNDESGIKRFISIHAPRTGSDHWKCCLRNLYSVFQSTLPARGATRWCLRWCLRYCQFQSTLPARGATGICNHHGCRLIISIHAPRTGSDLRHLHYWSDKD